jgi:ankyrin repeat protein
MIFCSVSFAQDHSQALIEAAKQGDLEQVRELLDKGADVNVRYINGMTVLMAAARGGNLEIVKLLIEKGADVNSSDRFGRTVFSSAARGGTWK